MVDCSLFNIIVDSLEEISLIYYISHLYPQPSFAPMQTFKQVEKAYPQGFCVKVNWKLVRWKRNVLRGKYPYGQGLALTLH